MLVPLLVALTDRNLPADEDVYLNEEKGVEHRRQRNPSNIDLSVSRPYSDSDRAEPVRFHLIGKDHVGHDSYRSLGHHHLYLQTLDSHAALLVLFYLLNHLLKDDVGPLGILEEKRDAVGSCPMEFS